MKLRSTGQWNRAACRFTSSRLRPTFSYAVAIRRSIVHCARLSSRIHHFMAGLGHTCPYLTGPSAFYHLHRRTTIRTLVLVWDASTYGLSVRRSGHGHTWRAMSDVVHLARPALLSVCSSGPGGYAPLGGTKGQPAGHTIGSSPPIIKSSSCIVPMRQEYGCSMSAMTDSKVSALCA